MRWLLPLVLTLFGAILLRLATRSGELSIVLVERGLVDELESGVATVQLGAALGIFGVFLVGFGIWMMWQWATDKSEVYAVWAQMLEPVAREYGRLVESHETEGLGFVSHVDGVRTEVLVQPMDEGFSSVWVAAPARQLIMILPVDAPGALADDHEWRLAGQRPRWVLRAELPALARPLLEDVRLVESVEHLLDTGAVKAIRHDHRGIEVLLTLVPPERLAHTLRLALAMGRHLRRVNG